MTNLYLPTFVKLSALIALIAVMSMVLLESTSLASSGVSDTVPADASGSDALIVPGNVVVCRVGTGSLPLTNAATEVFLDEYTPAGALVNTIAMPVAASGANNALTANGTATTECQLTRSANGNYLIVTGYNAVPGTANPSGISTATIQRVIGRVDASGGIDTSTTTTAFSASNIRSATADDGLNYWAVGANSGVVYLSHGGSGGGTIISTTVTNNRSVNIFGGQLYVSGVSGTPRLSTVGTGLPTTSGQTITSIPGAPAGTPNQYFFADLDAGTPGLDTLYIADEGAAGPNPNSGGVKKYALVAGSWTFLGIFPASVSPAIPASGFIGISGSVSASTVTLFASRGNGLQLVSFVDSTGYNVAPTAIPVLLSAAPTNTAFRGVAMAPGAAPSNQPPVIDSTAPATATEDTLYTYNATRTDPDGPGQVWSLLGTHTCGGSIVAGTGVFTFTPAGPVPAASCVLAIQVCDGGTPNLCATQTTTVNIAAVNDPPVAVDDSGSTPMNTAFVVPGASLASNDIDLDGPGLNVTAVSNPTNGAVNLATGTVTFTPTTGFTGTAGFDYTVSDGSLTDSGHVTVTVTAPSFSGTLNVGTGEPITSLTNNGGLFQALNAGTLSGNLTVNITSDMTGETGTHALNQPAETGVGGYTVFFQASGGARLIEGSNATGLIVLNGADRVTFSGLAFGPGGLTVRNTGVGAAIRFVNDASNNSIVNCTVEGGTSGIANGVVMIGAGSTTGNDNNAISDSTIRDRTDAAAVPLQLLYIDGSGAATSSGITISNNRFINFDLSAITSSAAENLTISGNTISQTAARTSGLGPIQVLLNQGSSAVSGNTVRDHSTNSTFTGLRIQGNVGSIGVSANRIHNIDNAPGSAGQLTGVELDGSSGASSVTMVNNMISITPGTASAQAVIGVNDLRTAGSLTMNYNSVLVGGTATGSNSWAYRRVTGAASSVSLTGNLLFNNRTGPVDNFAIGDQSPGGGSWASNYNLFVGTGSTAANFFDAGGAAVDFAAWKSGPPARDANSIAGVSGTGPFNVANIFSSANDLHLVIGGFNPAINAGTEIGLSTDFDGQTRPFNGAPDIGADEVQTVPTAAEVSVGGRITTADGRGIRNIRVTVSGGDLAGPRSAITSAFGYWQVEGLTAGQSYVVSVGAKRYLFDPPARLVSPTDSMADVDFVGTLR